MQQEYQHILTRAPGIPGIFSVLNFPDLFSLPVKYRDLQILYICQIFYYIVTTMFATVHQEALLYSRQRTTVSAILLILVDTC